MITSNPEKQKDIEALRASAAIGSLEDIGFLKLTFENADAVYCMIPPNFSEPNQVDYYQRIGENYANAIRASTIKRVVELSSYGAHLEKGTGFIVGSHKVENMFNALPEVKVTHIRPGYFYYNLLHFVHMIKTAGFIASNFGSVDKLAMVSPKDIAAAIAAEFETTGRETKIRYVMSDDRTCNEVAAILGNAIGKPDLQWKTLTNEQMQTALESRGMSAPTAATVVELGDATHKGLLREDYDLNKPIEIGKVKLEEFAKEFVVAFNQK
ncbi:MAG: NmrA family NAD(P)-binding protein [Segetibacter sp.]